MKNPTSYSFATRSIAAAAIGVIATSSLASATCISGNFSDDFESGFLNSPPWSIFGDGNWTADSTNPLQGFFSVKSPDLECLPGNCILTATAAIETCPDFTGGILSASYDADVCDPPDSFRVDVSGSTQFRVSNSTAGELLVDLPAGVNEVEFVYQFDSSVNRTCGNVTGAVIVDEVAITVDPDVPLNGTMDLWLVQDHFNITGTDLEELENVTLAWLYDNVGGPGEYRPTAVKVDSYEFGKNDDDSVVIETIAFRLLVEFVAKQSYIDWIDDGQPDSLMSDIEEILKNRNNNDHEGRQLQSQCRGIDKTLCCSNNAINNDRPSVECRAIGCNRRRCGQGGGRGDGDGNLSNVEFANAVATDTQNFEPIVTESVLGAPDLEKVAFCAAMRFAFETEGVPFPCDVYVDSQCLENEDRLFEGEEEACTSAEPSLGPSLTPSVSAHPSSVPSTVPSNNPSRSPSTNPSAMPSENPSVSSHPSSSPTFNPPIAVDDDVIVYLNEAANIDVLANDVSSLELFVVEITDGPEPLKLPNHGIDTINGEDIRKRDLQQAESGVCEIINDGKLIRYTPNEGFLGEDSCGYRGT